MDEEWRTIAGFSRYKISSHGKVMGGRWAEKILTPRPCTDGYLAVGITDDYGNRHTMRIARMVATAFIPNPEGKPEVDHIDRNPANNMATNLRWATRTENNHNRGSWASTGEMFVHKVVCESYIVRMTGMRARSFQTLEEAVTYRDRVLASGGVVRDTNNPSSA